MFCDQVTGDDLPERPADVPAGSISVLFPRLELALVWPTSVANPYCAPGEPNPLRFPYRDALVVALLDAGYAPENIFATCFGTGWSDTWPDLDECCARERERLLALDARCDVAIGAFILDNFREERFFAAVDAPTDVLLRAVAAAIAAVASIVSRKGEMVTGDIPAIESPHFGVRWYDPNARYQNGEQSLTYVRTVFLSNRSRRIRERKSLRVPEDRP